MNRRKVKIICTLGPASSDRDVLGAMIGAGMTVARLNFSHGTHEGHLQTLNMVRGLSNVYGDPVPVMLDTKGPEIRTGLVEGGSVEMIQGETFSLRLSDETPGNSSEVWVTYPLLGKEVKLGQDIYIDDGTIHLKIDAIEEDRVVCKIVVGGTLGNRKGINVPGANFSFSAMSDKDREDILWGVKNDVDFVAVSFVRDRNDVLAVRKVIEDAGGGIKIIAKIETRQGVENIHEIAEVVDGMMIARGDLGVEIATEEVPLVQKRIIDICRSQGKPVIVATQMLDSMIRNPRPTRAEASDVANAVLDGADVLMLSGETAAGKYPIESVETMSRIIAKAEEQLKRWQRPFVVPSVPKSVPDAVSMAAVEIAAKTEAKAILSLTRSGITARMVSKYRPECPVIATTPSEKTQKELSLSWGVIPIFKGNEGSEDQAIEGAVGEAMKKGLLSEGDMVVITAGMPLDLPGTTNMVRVHTIGRMVVRGLGVIPKIIAGKVFCATGPEEAMSMPDGAILVTPSTDRDYLPALKRAGALITEEGGLTSPSAIFSLELGLPCIVNAVGCTGIMKTGSVVTVDSGKGFVYEGTVNVGG
ncbi:pyruvate kinase [Dethiosulfovibrio salsuginis]|uniref:Pyruvate kinase n=1 Tax=Dethiosulfovibrio salsuginis TaxID=561720 RepID=A0A1X7KSC7_9BACT|nr:pyruvate kinase [Dethiosulfovibrio salsuginis]SMG43672.1 pyruvate kinase [Dethiosulfovibrio salsuginis]